MAASYGSSVAGKAPGWLSARVQRVLLGADSTFSAALDMGRAEAATSKSDARLRQRAGVRNREFCGSSRSRITRSAVYEWLVEGCLGDPGAEGARQGPGTRAGQIWEGLNRAVDFYYNDCCGGELSIGLQTTGTNHEWSALLLCKNGCRPFLRVRGSLALHARLMPG